MVRADQMEEQGRFLPLALQQKTGGGPEPAPTAQPSLLPGLTLRMWLCWHDRYVCHSGACVVPSEEILRHTSETSAPLQRFPAASNPQH